MKVFGKCLRQSVSQWFYHDVVVVIWLTQKALTYFFLAKASWNSEGSNKVLFARAFWGHEVSLTHVVVLSYIELLSQHVEFANRCHWFVSWVDLHIIIINLICREKTYNCSALNLFVLNKVIEHCLRICEQLFGLFTNCLVLENLRVTAIRIFSTYLPCHEKWIPINIRQDKCQVKVSEYFSTQERWFFNIH